MAGTRLLSLNVMQKIFSKIRNQHGSLQIGCLLSFASVGIFLAILIPQWMAHIDRIRERGGSTQEVWIASVLLLGSPIALTILVGWVIALLEKRKDQLLRFNDCVIRRYLFCSYRDSDNTCTCDFDR